MRTKAISRKLAKRKAELESEAYQVGSFEGASLGGQKLQRVGLTQAARRQGQHTAVCTGAVTKPGCLSRARVTRSLGRASARQRLCREHLSTAEGSQRC